MHVAICNFVQIVIFILNLSPGFLFSLNRKYKSRTNNISLRGSDVMAFPVFYQTAYFLSGVPHV